MTLKKYSFWAETAQLQGLRLVAERDGIRESEQIRRAIDAWLKTKNVKKATAPTSGPKPRRKAGV